MTLQVGDRVEEQAQSTERRGRAGVIREAARGRGGRGRPLAASVRVREDVEIEVRDALYGWRSGSVERPSGGVGV